MKCNYLLGMAVCAFLAAGFGTAPAFAATGDSQAVAPQNHVVTGTVTDESGLPLEGVAVFVTGTTRGTSTSADGSFSVEAADGEDLTFSIIGYGDKHVTVSGNGPVRVVMGEDTEMLNELVVIGYGTQRKGDVTSSIASVKSEDFAIGNIGDAGDLIKGKVAGLSISKNSGDPNVQSTIRLRGVISIEGSSTPLILIDGVEGDLSTVAPENIESIDVLKDASAAAIYGTRGANGVMLITTKTGRRGESVRTTYSGYVAISNITKTLDFYTADDIRSGNHTTDFQDLGADTDWIDEITRTGFTHNHNFTVTGGGKSTTYSADFTYRDAQGTINTTYARDMKMKMNVAHWFLNDMVKVSFDLQKSLHKNSANNASDVHTLNTNIWHQAIIRNPTAPVYNADGSYNENLGASYYYNPVEMLHEMKGNDRYEQTRLTGNIAFEPIDGWTTNLMLSTVRSNDHTTTYYSRDYYSSAISSYKGQASQNLGTSQSDNLELTSTYKHQWGDHRFEVLAGYSYQYNEYDGFYAYNRDFPTEFFKANNLGSGLAIREGEASMSSYKNDNKLIGFFGRVSYGYANKYNVLLSMRHEGSSKFGADHKWGNFPSASLGWTISNEDFMSGFDWLNNLKLRAGFGVTGVIPGSSYISLTRYNYGGSYYYDHGKWVPGLEVASNPNPDLGWEKSTEYNIGLDFSVLDDRLGGSIDVYRKTTSDMLYDFRVPTPPNLYGSTMANVGKMRNQGIEISINAVPVRMKDFEWSTVLTASHNSNKLVSLSNDLYKSENYYDLGYLDEPITGPTHRMEVGQPVDRFYMLHTVGVTENGLWLVHNRETGEDLEYDRSKMSLSADNPYYDYVGHGLPNWYLGWNNSLRYKNWDLNMQFTSQLGFQIFNESRAYYEVPIQTFNQLKSVQKAPYGDGNKLSKSQRLEIVSAHLEDGDFLKLTNVTLGYTFNFKENNFVKNLRAYISADNLFTITGYTGVDPELANYEFGYFGNDYRDKYPSIRSFTLGVTVNF